MSDKMNATQYARYEQLVYSAKRMYDHWKSYGLSIDKALELAEASFGNEREYQRLKKEVVGR